MGSAACSIIVPLFNKVELTRACVDAVLAHTDPDSYELVLVDNGSSDETPEYCAGLPGHIVTIRNDKNAGFAGACNQGAAAASGDHLLFLNNDTEVHEGWLPPLLAHMADPDVGAVGAKLLFPDGTIQHCGVLLSQSMFDGDGFVALHTMQGAPADHPLAGQTWPYQVVTAAAILIRRSTFLKVDGFDEGFWNGYEDVDLCLKIGELGQRVMYEPRSVITHHESASGPERFRLTDQNVRRLLDRWSGKVTIDVRVGAFGDQSYNPSGAFSDIAKRAHIERDPTFAAPEGDCARETILERLELTQMQRNLDVMRGERDVCWLEGEDEHPLVTIRIATYDRGPLVVARAITSALAQTYSNIEVLVVGDACDEATTEAVHSVEDARVRFVRLPTRGLYPSDMRDRWMVAGGHPMVAALDLAAGSWLAPCDDDDELSIDHVEVLLTEAKHRRLEMVWSKADCEGKLGVWGDIGSPQLACGQITHGSVIYSLGLRRILPNVCSWRLGEPGDWNLWRRMNNIGVHMGFVDHTTYRHYLETPHRLAKQN